MLIADAFSKFVANFQYENLPVEVRERAKYLLLDAVGIALASSRHDFAKKALSALSRFEKGNSPVIGFSNLLSLRDAALLNGVLVHGLDYDDTYLPGSMHLTASAVPTALVVAKHLQKTGADLLAAMIVGMEVSARIAQAGSGLFQKAGFHPTGVCATFAAALSTGKLLGLDAERLTMAQGIALSTSAGTMQPTQDGSWTKRMHPGLASAGGITAAYAAMDGFIGPREAYEGYFGFYNVYLGAHAKDRNSDLLVDGLGERWEFMRSSVKLYPACHHIHAFANAAKKLRSQHSIDPKQIKSIKTLVADIAIPMVCEPASEKAHPRSSYIAQFSLQYAIACCLIRGKYGLEELEESSYTSNELAALAEKVEFEVDPNAGYPKFRTGEVIVNMQNGDVFRCREEIFPDDPEDLSAIVNKFLDNAKTVMKEAAALEILETILSADSGETASAIAKALSKKKEAVPA